MRTTVLFGGARKIRPTGTARPTGPKQCMACFNLGREELILEISMRDADALDEVNHALRFGDIACKRLLAGNAFEGALAAFDRVNDLFQILEPSVVWPSEPKGLDGGIRHHRSNGLVGL